MKSELMGVAEISQRLRIPEATIYKYVCQRRIPFVKLNGHLRFDPTAIDEWIKRNRVVPIAVRGACEDLCAGSSVRSNGALSTNGKPLMLPARALVEKARALGGRKGIFSTFDDDERGGQNESDT